MSSENVTLTVVCLTPRAVDAKDGQLLVDVAYGRRHSLCRHAVTES
jgi:hypothetical protein